MRNPTCLAVGALCFAVLVAGCSDEEGGGPTLLGQGGAGGSLDAGDSGPNADGDAAGARDGAADVAALDADASIQGEAEAGGQEAGGQEAGGQEAGPGAEAGTEGGSGAEAGTDTGAGVDSSTGAESGVDAGVTCDKVASLSGSDSNDGSPASPLRTVQALYEALSAGQTGCLREGVYDSAGGGYVLNANGPSGVSGAPITLRSYPNEHATLKGSVEIKKATSFLTLTRLSFDETEAPTVSAVTVLGTDILFEEDEFFAGSTKHFCMSLGGSSLDYGIATRVTVRKNKFRDCGDPSSGNQDHAIYVEHTDSVRITQNIFLNTAAYAIHFYPAAQTATVDHNIFDGSGYGAVIFASDQDPTGYHSDNNVFENNIVSNGARAGITYWWGSGGEGTGNVARNNCLWNNVENIYLSGSGIADEGNIVADPAYLDRSSGDYRLGSTSGCLTVVGYDIAALFDW
jgi:hypothetical protein